MEEMTRRDLFAGAVGISAVAMLPRVAMACGDTNKSMLGGLANKPLTKFAFGSCNRNTWNQEYWQHIVAENPDLWIWMGDNIYANNYSTKDRMAAYDKMKAGKFYSMLRERVPLIGTWDDHDFRDNDRDGQWDGKEGSKQAAMRFLDMDAAKVEGHEGIYQSYAFGPVGQRLKVILLDIRFNMNQTKRPYGLLGEKQWEWLRAEIDAGDFELLVIGSSQNVLNSSGAQSWAAFPAERAWLLQLLSRIDPPVLFLSGDRHHADFSKVEVSGKPIYEFMSSGLNWYNPIARTNNNRIGNPVCRVNFGVVDINWSKEVPELKLSIKSCTNGQLLQQTVILDQ